MSDLKNVVLVGAGQASAVAARTLRRRGYDGTITVVGDEPHPPYQRPPLSKEYLIDGEADDLYLLAEEWCAAQRIELILGRPVRRVSPGEAGVELADGRVLPADAVLLATGGRPRRLASDSDRVTYLRTKDDADRLRAQLVPGARVVVIGAGFIGSEVAAGARRRGADVTVVETLSVPLQRVLGAEVGAACAHLHRAHGVTLRLGESVVSVVDASDCAVVTTSGARLEADVVVVGIGIEPNVDVARASGLAVDNGVLVDAHCRTSNPGVFAAGDVANHDHPLFGERLRVEHFDNANRQAAAAANAMLGRGTPFADPHWFWSDQYDVNLQHTGHAPTWDELVIRGRVDELDFAAFYLRGGVVRAAFGMDRGADVVVAKELIAGRVSVDAATLRDEDVDLAELAELEAL